MPSLWLGISFSSPVLRTHEWRSGRSGYLRSNGWSRAQRDGWPSPAPVGWDPLASVGVRGGDLLCICRVSVVSTPPLIRSMTAVLQVESVGPTQDPGTCFKMAAGLFLRETTLVSQLLAAHSGQSQGKPEWLPSCPLLCSCLLPVATTDPVSRPRAAPRGPPAWPLSLAYCQPEYLSDEAAPGPHPPRAP